jgi:hypothetical protein
MNAETIPPKQIIAPILPRMILPWGFLLATGWIRSIAKKMESPTIAITINIMKSSI